MNAIMQKRSTILTLVLAASLSVLTAIEAGAQTVNSEEFVDAMRTLAGNHKARASGAKGQCVAGTFTPTAKARTLSRSVLFKAPSKVLARFSVGGGNPKAPDAIKTASRGLAIRLGDGTKGRTEFVAVNAPVHFARTPEQMLAYVKARLPGADGKPDPAKIKAFTDANPETANQGKFIGARPVPASWVAISYWAVHGYTLTNAKGAKNLVKFKFVPTGGEAGLTDDEAKAKAADFLVSELGERIAVKAATSFDLVAILGRAGDEKTPATETWANEDQRPTVKLGTVTITALAKNEICDAVYFDPAELADGIAGPKDEALFTARKPAYAVSLGKRS